MLKKLSPYWIINLSFISLILIGSLLLFLPFSVKEGHSISYVDAFFLSTSAVTITGLSTISNLHETLSTFGQIILILLVQIGGLSVITLSVFIMMLFKAKIGINERVLIKESLNQNSLQGVVKRVKKIVITALIIETVSFLINLIVFLPIYEFKYAVGVSAFHAISSFNNAGFDILGANSLKPFTDHVLLNLNTIFTIMLGGIGFIVIHDILEKRSYKKLNIHSKIVIKVNLILWIGGTLLFKISQTHGNPYNWLQAFFLSVTSRTAGFTTIELTTLSMISVLILMGLMFIGASPAGTGGGIKVTTFYTIAKTVKSYATGKKALVDKREISMDSRYKAFTLTMLAMSLIVVGAIVILTFDDLSLSSVMVEAVSAFANVGLSQGLTPDLHSISKIALCILMFAGRVGPLTLISIFNKKWKRPHSSVEYLEEKIIIG
ncbi:TrkH family potassium uptake protein [Acholeplasma hippikon]|uniref:Ktr system potassium uptake protein B n=1 Tax=Acholeplasma hippikon TaxID=264636 RepID=A0A449BHV3_9MOLU|nr:potassium transporter TrkG [Acholeplasma hippikon]VEU82020.1 Ktr system potassium uptake protein B [Acholeplasma hippikon]